MKVRLLILIVTGVLLSQLPCSAGFCLTSPDRPAIWYNRAGDKLNQSLAWSSSKGELILYVTYNRVQFLQSRDDLLVDNFQLSFPSVRLDRSQNRLYFVDKANHRMTIGRLDSGLGNGVVLAPGVKLSAHRQNGVLVASIISTSRD
jgi:hypothetical protein